MDNLTPNLGYNPTVSNDYTELKKNISDNLDNITNDLDKTLGLIDISLREYRDTLSEADLQDESRKVRTAREDNFMNSFIDIKNSFNDLKNNINLLITRIESKNKEQDEYLKIKNTPTTGSGGSSVGSSGGNN